MSLNEVLNLALQLSEEERKTLAVELLESLEAPEPGYEEAWRAEIAARLQSIEQGNVVARDWREALDDIRRSLHRGPDA
jgi:putative addiction module component (TIGR02574 family)